MIKPSNFNATTKVTLRVLVHLTILFIALTISMAWRCSGNSNDQLITNLKSSNIIQSREVENAMRSVDRTNYAPSSPYQDSPQSIGYQATISAPHMHAHALEVLKPCILQDDAKVLDVGCGSGYLAAVLGRMTPENGKVWGIDYIPQLVELSETNTLKEDADLLESGKVSYTVGDGWNGIPEEAPFSCIHVGAAASSIPLELVRQLQPGGIMIIPVGPRGGNQYLMKVTRTTDEGRVERSYTSENLMGVRYVPLVQL